MLSSVMYAVQSQRFHYITCFIYCLPTRRSTSVRERATLTHGIGWHSSLCNPAAFLLYCCQPAEQLFDCVPDVLWKKEMCSSEEEEVVQDWCGACKWCHLNRVPWQCTGSS